MFEPGTVFKVGQKRYMEEMRDTGILYMNNVPYFWGIEDGAVRGDKNDTVGEYSEGLRGEIRTPSGQIIPVNISSWDLRILPHRSEEINIFCMYSLRKSTCPIDKRIGEFGEWVLLITDCDRFFNRIRECVDSQKLDAHFDLVDYVPKGYIGEIGPFRKFQKYEWQAEWRLVVYNGNGGPFRFELGSIAEFSELVPTKMLLDMPTYGT